MFAAVIQACMAVATGILPPRPRLPRPQRGDRVADCRPIGSGRHPDGVAGTMQWMLPYGAFSGPNWMGLVGQPGTCTSSARRASRCGAIALNARRNAQLNPKAVMRRAT